MAAPRRALASTIPSYRQSVLADNPSVYYRLDEPTGVTANDSSGNGNNGTYASDVTFGVPGALASDSDMAVATNHNPPDVALTAGAQNLPNGDSPRTVEYWFNGGVSRYVTNGVSYGSDFSVGVGGQGSQFLVTGGGNTATFNLASPIGSGWVLFDVTFDGSSVSLYLNGQLQSSQPLTADTDLSVNGLTLGTTGGAYGDQFDEMAIYPSALTAAQIDAHWTAGDSPTATSCATAPTSPYASLVLSNQPSVYYRLDDFPSSLVAYDSSGHCDNGAYDAADTSVPGAVAGESDTAIQTNHNPPDVAMTTSGENLPSGDSPRTVEFWFSGGLSRYVNNGVSYGSDFFVGVGGQGSQIVVTGGGNTLTFPFSVDSSWALIDVTFDGSSVSLYLNGQLQTSQLLTADTDLSTNGLALGTLGGAYGDKFDEMAIYPSALSAAQIDGHWTAGESPTATACASTPTSAYTSKILANHPSVYYRLDDFSSSLVAYDSSGHCDNGAYDAADTSVPGAVASESDTAIQTNHNPPDVAMTGSGQDLPSGDSPRTVEFWFSGGLSRYVNNGVSYGSDFFVGVGGQGSAIVVTGGGNTLTFPFSVDSTWALIDVTFDGSSASLYLNGQFQSSQPLTADTVLSTNGLILGTQGGAYGDKFDEMAIYPNVLSAAQIDAHWTAGESPTATACATAPTSTYASTVLANHPSVYYRLDDFSSSLVAYDSSGHCDNGAYDAADTSVPGAIANESATAIQTNHNPPDVAMTASGQDLPSGDSPRTVEFWVNGYLSRYVDNGVSYGSDFFVGIGEQGSAIVVRGSGNRLIFPASIGGDWVLIDVAFDGSSVSAYENGQLVGSAPLTADTVLSTNGMTLGTDGGAYGDKFDELAIYGSDLSPTQIATHALVGEPQAILSGGGVLASETFGGGGFCLPCLMKSLIHTIFGFPVDTEDGNLYHTFNDIQISGRGYPLAFSRTYNSMAAGTNGPLGYGWVDNLGANLAIPASITTGSKATLTEENGAQTVFTFDGSNWTVPPRDIATLAHNGDGTWTLKRDAQQTLIFNSLGQLKSMTDLNGNTTTYSYTGGQLTTVTDSAGRTLQLGYTGGHITKVTDPNVTPSRMVTFAYDSAGDLAKVTDVNGGTTKFTYDGSHRMLTMKDPKCSATSGCPGVTNHYDSSGRVDYQTDQLNRKTMFVYAGDPSSAVGGTTTITDPKGNVTLDTYEYGVKVSETKGYGTAQAATTTYRYDPATVQPTSITDPNGNTTLMTYDGQGNMLTKQDPLGRTTTYSNYNGLNEAQTIQDPKGVITTNTYDPAGNLTKVSTPCSDCTPVATQTTMYSVCETTTTCTANGTTYRQGDVESMTDPDGKTWTYAYDAYGNRVSTIDPLGDKSTSSYNADDRLLTTTSPNGNILGCACAAQYTTKYSYVISGTKKTDEFGDVQAVTDPLGHVTKYSYDADRNKTSATDPDGNKSTYIYDLANEQTAVKRPGGTVTSTTYWPDGTVKQQIDGKHNPIQSYTYDSLGRTATETDALGNVTTNSYDPAGNKITQQDPGGDCSAVPGTKCTTMTYDVDNEPTSITYSDGTTPNVTNITYDRDGQRTGMTDGTGSGVWNYDSLHRLTSYTNGAGATVSYTYNLRNLPITITYPGGHTVTRGYDDAGRLTSVQDWLGTPNTTTFGYDADGNVTSDTLPNGVADTYQFNAADQLRLISDMKSATTIFSATYTRDGNGQLTADSSQANNQGSYKYTALNQLCYAGSGTAKACSKPPTSSYPYGYDAADNLTAMENAAHSGTNTQSFNEADQLISAGASTTTACNPSPPSGITSFCSDTRGNRTSAVSNMGAATCNTFDQADQLTSIQTGTGPSCTSPTNVGTYAYDGTGLRMSKAVGGTTTQFTWDESGDLPMLLQEQAGVANPTSYIYGPGGLPVEMLDPSGTAHFYAHDQLGSTRALTNTSGTVEATYAYDPYGNVVSKSGTVANPFQFAGQYKDTESALYYLRARYYDPTTAQFLTRDPLSETTRTFYGYAGSNPTNATDPSGKLCFPPWDGNQCDNPATEAVQAVSSGQVCLSWQPGCSNAGDNLVNNIHIAETTPIAGPLLKIDPFIGPLFDLAKLKAGEDVSALSWLNDAAGLATFGGGWIAGARASYWENRALVQSRIDLWERGAASYNQYLDFQNLDTLYSLIGNVQNFQTFLQSVGANC